MAQTITLNPLIHDPWISALAIMYQLTTRDGRSLCVRGVYSPNVGLDLYRIVLLMWMVIHPIVLKVVNAPNTLKLRPCLKQPHMMTIWCLTLKSEHGGHFLKPVLPLQCFVLYARQNGPTSFPSWVPSALIRPVGWLQVEIAAILQNRSTACSVN